MGAGQSSVSLEKMQAKNLQHHVGLSFAEFIRD